MSTHTKMTLSKILAGASVAALALSSAPAFAQAADSSARDSGDEILVVGTTRQLERNLDVPIAITAFSGDDLQTKSAVKVADVATFTPGFSVAQAPGNATALSLALRGQVQTDILATLEPSVGVYVDDLYWARAYGLNAGLLDISNAQVLKGPQGTLFGRNTTGGALVLSSNDPSLVGFSGRASATYGRFNEFTGDAMVNLPLGERVAVRGAFQFSSRDGWAYGVRLVDAAGVINNTSAPSNVIVPAGKKYNDLQQVQGRLKARFELSTSTDLILSGEWYDYNANGPARQTIYKVQLNNAGSAGDQVVSITGVNKYISYFIDHPNAVGVDAFDCSFAINQTLNCTGVLSEARAAYTKAKTQTYSGRLTSNLGVGTLKLAGGYRNVQSENFIDLDGSGSMLHGTSLEQDLSQWSVEANFAGKLLAEKLDYVVGGTFFHESGSDLSYAMTGSGGSVPGRATRNIAFIDNDSFGIYSQLHYKLTDKLSVTGGIRYSDDKKGIEIRSANVNQFGQLAGLAGNVYPTGYVAGGISDPCNASGAGIIAGAVPSADCAVPSKAAFNSISWTAGADYKPSDDVLLYAKISKGYRSGGHNMRAFNTAQFVPFLPETVLEEEVGVKAQLADRAVTLTLAGYHSELSDAQRSTIVTTGTASNTIVGNAAKVRNVGVEGELSLKPVEGLTLSASGSINDSKYLSYSDASGDRSNERFQYLPKYKFALGGEYRTMVAADVSLRMNADYGWQGETASSQCSLTGASACWTGTSDINGLTPAQISQQILDATTLPASGVLNARLTFGFSNENYTLAVWGRNITDNRNYTHALSVMNPNRNYVSGLRRDPATYGVTATAKF